MMNREDREFKKARPKYYSGVKMRIDETNIGIIKELRDGRRSFKAIADSLGVTENTVRTRVKKLQKEGLLDITALVDPEGLPGHRLVMVGVKLDTMELVKKGEEFSRLKGVVSVGVVTGRFDLILTVLLNGQFDLLEFYSNEVSRIKEVQSVETFVIYKGYNLKIPYVLP
jgi:Lrp/AsnC family transcriptional regulator, regulator for asnA, asnC and gidA